MAAVWVVACAAVAQARYGMNLDDKPVTELAHSGAPAIVLFITASDCPIANRYIPEIVRLQHEFSGEGVQFWQVYPNPGDTAAVVRKHQAQFGGPESIVLDTSQTLVRMSRVTVTPEAVIFVPEGGSLREVYRGRIDDRYLDLGSERPRAQHHDLENAIAAVLEHKPVPQPGGPPVGCGIVTRQP